MAVFFHLCLTGCVWNYWNVLLNLTKSTQADWDKSNVIHRQIGQLELLFTRFLKFKYGLGATVGKLLPVNNSTLLLLYLQILKMWKIKSRKHYIHLTRINIFCSLTSGDIEFALSVLHMSEWSKHLSNVVLKSRGSFTFMVNFPVLTCHIK